MYIFSYKQKIQDTFAMSNNCTDYTIWFTEMLNNSV